MKIVKSFIKALGKNYYFDFIILAGSEDIDYLEHYVLVEYENQDFYEKSLEKIQLRQEEIIKEIKKLYEDSLSEIYLNLSTSDPENFDSFIKFNIEAIKIQLKTLKSDFYVDEKKSRYCSLLLDNAEVGDLYYKHIAKRHYNNLLIGRKIPTLFSNFDFKNENIKTTYIESFYFNEFHLKRFKTLSNLPLSLFLIGYKFILELIKIQNMIVDIRESKEINPKIKWTGKRTHIGFVLGTLAQNGYLDAPKGKNGEINYTAFAKLIRQNFEVEGTEDTLRKYLNPDDEKFIESQKTFDKEGFKIPHSKLLG